MIKSNEGGRQGSGRGRRRKRISGAGSADLATAFLPGLTLLSRTKKSRSYPLLPGKAKDFLGTFFDGEWGNLILKWMATTTTYYYWEE